MPTECPTMEASGDDLLNPARREYRAFRRLAIAAIILSCAICVSLNLADPDLWGHVLYGQELLSSGALPKTATHTFTAPEHRWINHENLAEIALALGYRHLGTTGLLVAKCLLGMGILGLMVWVARCNGVDMLTAWAMMLLIANNLVAFFPLRPQLFSFLCFAVLLAVLDRAGSDWEQGRINWRWLCWAPLIFIVWANAHGGFVAGLCIFETYLAGRAIELWARDGRRSWPVVLRLAAVGIASAGATLLTPYGLDLWLWLARSLSEPRPEITEWAPPKPSDPIFVPFVLLVAVMVACWWGTRRRRDWTQIVILALVTWQAATHLRHIALLALLCGFWLPVHAQSALSRLRPSGAAPLPDIRLSPWLRIAAIIALGATIGLSCVALMNRLSSLPVYRNRYPVDAIQFMADNKLHGKLVVSFNWAQYAMAALAPDVKVAFDGRYDTCYPQEIVDMHFDFLLGDNGGDRFRSPKSGPIDGRRVFGFGHPDLVLVDRTYPESVKAMRAEVNSGNSAWTLLYQDGIAQLWGRREEYDNPNSANYLQPSKRVLNDTQFASSEPWPALPVASQESHTQVSQARLNSEPGQPGGSQPRSKGQPLRPGVTSATQQSH